MATNNKIQFRDDAIHISSSTDGQLDLVADTEIQIAATTIDINGAINASGEIIAASLDISGDIDVDGTTNLDVVDIDGAVDMASTLTVGSLLTVNDGAVFNEGSADKDFRVESNGQTHALFVDGGLDNVGIGYSSKPTATLQGLNILTGGGNGGIQLNREVGGNPSDGETLGSYAWKGVDGANNNAAAEASIVAIAAEDHSGSTAATSMTFNTKPTGTGPGSAPTERMRINSSGQVGIGASPVRTLQVHTAGSNSSYISINNGNTGATVNDGVVIGAASDSTAYFWNYENAAMGFATNNTERARFDASGRLLIASSTAVTGNTTAKLQINGTDNSGSTISIGRFSNNANAPVLNFIKSRNGTVGGNTIVQDGDNLGSILFGGNDGTDNVSVGAKIFGEVDGTPGSNDMPGRLTFFTTADGASSPTERMRIKSTGNLELALGTPLQATADGRAVNVSVGTSFVTILDFSTIGGTNAGTGFYLVTVVREGASVGTSITLQVGVSSSGLVIIYDTLQAVGLTAQASNAQIQVKQNSGGAVDCHATAIPMSITGNDT
jgi:cytoskeletal protein CcmA (bactofilin family)